jgi:spermidine synthase
MLGIEVGMTACAAGVALCLSQAGSVPTTTPLQAYILVIPLLVIAGFLTGAEFPLATRLCSHDDAGETGTAGYIYGADLLGGWIGGVAGAALLAPVLGLPSTCLLLTLLKGGSWLVLRTGLRKPDF